MATYNLAFHTRLDNYAVLQTFVDTEIQTQDSVVIAGASHGFSGTQTVISTEPYLFLGVDAYGDLLFDYSEIVENQIIYKNTGTDFERSVATGTVAFTPSVSWITSAMVLEFLGIDVATANDTAYIATCVAASNYWCWNKRRESNYADSQTTVPDNSVKLGAILYAATLYRERGSADSFASFDSMSSIPIPSTLGRIMQLLGTSRASVA